MIKGLPATFGILLLTGALTIQSCNTKDDLLKTALAGKTFDAPSTNFTIPIIAGVHQSFISLDSVKLDFNIDNAIRENTDGKAGIDDADKIVIKSLSMSLTDADPANNWANLDTVNIYLSSNTASTPSKVAMVINADRYSELVSGNVFTTLNAKDYLKGNQVFYIFYGTNRRATTKALHGKIDVQFGIE